MDDGFQSARIQIDYALIVVDARYGIGNGWVLPAGPMRARLVDQLRYADGALADGRGRAAPIGRPRRIARRQAGLRGRDGPRDPAALCRPAVAGLCRHRPSGQVLRDVAAGRR